MREFAASRISLGFLAAACLGVHAQTPARIKRACITPRASRDRLSSVHFPGQEHASARLFSLDGKAVGSARKVGTGAYWTIKLDNLQED
jgi:hypothetical protein